MGATAIGVAVGLTTGSTGSAVAGVVGSEDSTVLVALVFSDTIDPELPKVTVGVDPPPMTVVVDDPVVLVVVVVVVV
ncbi:hypothetical protein NM203_07770 [Mycolicibacterium sp. CAU 1645]|uniref:Secreted protein n=1 Tax=Mycolicibacterium arenosum TaxID=2952157 RepID=A0ABT1M2K6_9MYCO|nr:hypothetical protein [Mycolicibacterium sp. CAU 1645]